jgi:hypothetical protein
MAWRGPATPRDPLLDTALFRRNRRILKAQRRPCSVCGAAIDYSVKGSMHAGHIVSRRKAKLLGWGDAQVNALSNLRVECRRCSIRSGAREGQLARAAKMKQAKGGYRDDSHRW